TDGRGLRTRDHSILLKAGAVPDAAGADADAGFTAGVQRSAHLAEGLLAALFETRTAQLLLRRSRAWASAFLSGLLIGAEIAGLSTKYSTARGVQIIGDAQLAALYQRVFADRGVATRSMDDAACAIAGLRYLYESGRRGAG
ncbi:MAG: 2-dehydro-3-deoxygalactonokinase, partial [Steroidobacteraceae bacterium]